MSERSVPLSDLADIIRSKNAGPYRITLDILFSDPERYRLVRDSGAVTRESVAAAYGIPPEEISSMFEVDTAGERHVWLPAARAAPRPSGQRGACLSMRITRPWAVVLLGGPLAFLFAFFVIPFTLVIVESLRSKDGTWTAEHYAKILGESY